MKSVLGAVNPDLDLGKLHALISQLKLVEMRRKALDRVVVCENLDAQRMSQLVDSCRQLRRSQSEAQSFDSIKLERLCSAYQQLINLYAYLLTLTPNSNPSESLSKSAIAFLLHVSEERVEECLHEIEKYRGMQQKSATGHQISLGLSEFLNNFDWASVSETNPDGLYSLQLQSADNSEAYKRLANFIFEPFFHGASINAMVQQILPAIGLEIRNILGLFITAWFETEHQNIYLPQFFEILTTLAKYAKDKNWLEQMEAGILRASDLGKASALTLVTRGVAASLIKEMEKNWEIVNETIEKWDQVLFMLQHLINFALFAKQPHDITLKTFLVKGQAYLAEILSRKLVADRRSVHEILPVYENLKALKDDWQTQLRSLVEALPKSLCSDYLLSNCAWESASTWSKQPEFVDLLPLAVEFLRDIGDSQLLHGLSYFIWQNVAAERFQKLVLLIEKVGKAPKDRLCRKEVGLTETQILPFAEFCADLLDILANANADCVVSAPNLRSVEDFVDRFFGTFSADAVNEPTALVSLAFRQKCTNFHQVLHHKRLAMVVVMGLESGMKPIKPMNLYDENGRNAFFKGLLTYPFMKEVDSSAKNNRHLFFASYINTKIGQLNVNDSLPNFSLMFKLASEWEIDEDSLIRSQIVSLFAHGIDELAEQHIHQVKHKAILGSDLLLLAGERLQQKLQHSQDFAISFVSPDLRTWLKSIDSGQVKSWNSTKDSIRRLLHYVNVMLPKEHAEHRIAAQLDELLNHMEFE